MSQTRVRNIKRLSLLVASIVLLAVGAVYFALAKTNTDANAADDYPYAGTLKIEKNYYESFDSANLTPTNQVYAGDDILYVLKITNISSNPESRFGGTINVDDELSPDVMGDVHVEDIIINAAWMTQSQIDGMCGVNNSYVLHCSLSADLFSTNPLTNTEGDSIEIRIKAKATVHGTSDSYQLHNRAYVYSGDDVDNDGPDCKTLADAKLVDRCHSDDVVFCVVMPKIEVDKIVNKSGRVTCYFYANKNNADKAREAGFKLKVDNDDKMAIYRDIETNELTFPKGTLNEKEVNLLDLVTKKDITEETGSYESNCMNNDGGAVNYDYEDADVLWEEKKATSEFISKYWTPAREEHANDDPAPSEKQIEEYAKNKFVKDIVGTLNYTDSATNGFIDDQSVKAGERIEYTITVRNTGSAVTKGGETDGVYIYDQFDPQFFDNNDIYVQPLTGGVTCKVEQSKMTCYTDRPLAPYDGVTTERNFTALEANDIWESMSSADKASWITEAKQKFIDECNNNTAGAIASAKATLASLDGQIQENDKNIANVQNDLTKTREQQETINKNLAQARQAYGSDNENSALVSLISALESQLSSTNALITSLENQLTSLRSYGGTLVIDYANTEGIISALETGTQTCIETADTYAEFQAKQDFIDWKITQMKTVLVLEGGGELCVEGCNPDDDPSGYYMNGQYGLGSLAINDEIKIRVTAIPNNTGEIKNIAYAGGGGDLLCPNNDTNSYCHSDWVTTFVSAPELHINKELRNNTDDDMGTSLVRGTEGKYIIKVTNEGTADTKGMIVIHDVIPDYLEVNRTTLSLSFDDSSYSYEAGFCEFRGTSSHELYCRAYDTIEGGLFHRSGVWTIEFNVRVLEDAEIDENHNKVVNYAYVYGGEDPVCKNEEILLTIKEAFNSGKINPYDRCYDYLGHSIVSPKLTVSKGVDKIPTNNGEKYNYWVTVENKGNYATTAETTVLDYLPEKVAISTNTLSQNCEYNDEGRTITCTIPAGMKPGAKQTFKYSAISTNLSGQVVNNVMIFGEGDGDCTNDAAAINTSRCHATVSTMAQSPLLKIETSASALEVYNGGQVAYLTSVKNIGNAQTVAETEVTIQMPTELRLLGVRASKGTCRVDLHHFECTFPAGIQAGETIYISTLTQATTVTDADTTLKSTVYGGGDPDCTEQVDTEEVTSRIFGNKVFADDTVPVDTEDGSNTTDSSTDTTTTEDITDDSVKTSEEATPPDTTTNGQTLTPAEPDTTTNKRCKSNASIRIVAMPNWATDIDGNGTGAPSAGILSTMQVLGTISMLGVASYMVLKSRKDFLGQEITKI